MCESEPGDTAEATKLLLQLQTVGVAQLLQRLHTVGAALTTVTTSTGSNTANHLFLFPDVTTPSPYRGLR
jgi:hypothetical protein